MTPEAVQMPPRRTSTVPAPIASARMPDTAIPKPIADAADQDPAHHAAERHRAEHPGVDLHRVPVAGLERQPSRR